MRAGQGLFASDDQIMTEAEAARIQHSIKKCRYVDFPTLNHFTVVFGVEPGPVEAIRAFLEEK
jgi:hypothetical protein